MVDGKIPNPMYPKIKEKEYLFIQMVKYMKANLKKEKHMEKVRKRRIDWKYDYS